MHTCKRELEEMRKGTKCADYLLTKDDMWRKVEKGVTINLITNPEDGLAVPFNGYTLTEMEEDYGLGDMGGLLDREFECRGGYTNEDGLALSGDCDPVFKMGPELVEWCTQVDREARALQAGDDAVTNSDCKTRKSRLDKEEATLLDDRKMMLEERARVSMMKTVLQKALDDNERRVRAVSKRKASALADALGI
eukprot:5163881-Prymnesium_polylepis.1